MESSKFASRREDLNFFKTFHCVYLVLQKCDEGSVDDKGTEKMSGFGQAKNIIKTRYLVIFDHTIRKSGKT